MLSGKWVTISVSVTVADLLDRMRAVLNLFTTYLIHKGGKK